MSLFLRLLILFSSFTLGAIAAENNAPTVLVSIAPYRQIVEKIAGDAVAVEVLVPPGQSSHTYEPRPSQLAAVSKTDIWFRIGESAEERTVGALQAYRPQMRVVDLTKHLDLIGGDEHHHCCGRHHDPHIWLSPRMVRQQAEVVADELIRLQPHHEDLYIANLREFIRELDALDRDLAELLRHSQNKTILVAHPAFAYFCRDYGLEQLAIEFEGKDPTPRRLTDLVQRARDLKILRIYVQPQHSRKGAEVLAVELNAEVFEIDPFDEDLLENLRRIGHAFAN